MKFVHDHGGKAIFVTYPYINDATEEENQRIYKRLNQKGCVDFLCYADYRDNSKLQNLLNRKLKL